VEIVPVEKIPESADVPLDNLMQTYAIIQKMVAICVAKHGIGLSAVQVGLPLKLFIANNSPIDDNFGYYLNCEYTPVGATTQESMEGCLSVEGQYLVNRYPKIHVIGKQLVVGDDLKLEDIDKDLEGRLAVVFQHEIDHQKGILISDIGRKMEMW
jgi:peptide deformylase